jgi:hypothetical protein
MTVIVIGLLIAAGILIKVITNLFNKINQLKREIEYLQRQITINDKYTTEILKIINEHI